MLCILLYNRRSRIYRGVSAVTYCKELNGIGSKLGEIRCVGILFTAYVSIVANRFSVNIYSIVGGIGYSAPYVLTVLAGNGRRCELINGNRGRVFGVYVVSSVTYCLFKKKMDSASGSTLIALAVFVNLGVWFIEQLVSYFVGYSFTYFDFFEYFC